MAYIDLIYFQNRVKEDDLITITSDKGEDAIINENRINAVISDAEAEFDNAAEYAGYSTPITSPNDYIKRIIFDLALYYLYARKYEDEEMKDVYVRYSKAHTKIDKIRKGEILLNGITKNPVELISPLVTNKISQNRIFKNCVLKSL